jgi:GLPGLI family protein
VIAWYSPKIPIGFGPKVEYGLPGLILELEIGNIIIKASKIIINPKEKIKVEKPKGGKFITMEEYKEIMNKVKKSVFGN